MAALRCDQRLGLNGQSLGKGKGDKSPAAQAESKKPRRVITREIDDIRAAEEGDIHSELEPSFQLRRS